MGVRHARAPIALLERSVVLPAHALRASRCGSLRPLTRISSTMTVASCAQPRWRYLGTAESTLSNRSTKRSWSE